MDERFGLRLRQTCLADDVLVVGIMASSVAANEKLSRKPTGIMSTLQNFNSGSALPSWECHWLLLVGTSALTTMSGTAIIAKRTITLRDLGCHTSGLANVEQDRLLVPSFARSDGFAPRRSLRSIMFHRLQGMRPRLAETDQPAAAGVRLGVNSAAAAKWCPNIVAGCPGCAGWGNFAVFGPAAMERRYLRGPSSDGRRIDRPEKTLATAFRRGRLDSRIGFILPEGVHLGKIGLQLSQALRHGFRADVAPVLSQDASGTPMI